MTNNTTRKKREKTEGHEIKMRNPVNTKSKSIKRNYLRMIREQQNRKYEDDIVGKNGGDYVYDNGKTTTDVEDTMDYFKNLEKNKQQRENLERIDTNKPRFSANNSNSIVLTNSGGNHPFINNTANTTNTIYNNPVASTATPTLLTSREPFENQSLFTTTNSTENMDNTEKSTILQPSLSPPSLSPSFGATLNSSSKNYEELRSMMRTHSGRTTENQNKFAKIKNKKQKRTMRKTFHLGKSTKTPKVSVLISNKTMRKNITTKNQLLKQIPIIDVKKYLAKHGFIRVGSTAPNDVLRKMYETTQSVCGVVENHNPDNLLYNFFHEK
jgi:hypothetical protein